MSSVITHLISHRAHKSGLFDLPHGFRLLGDRSVPTHLKLVALMLGALLTLLMELLQVPLEAVVAFLVPFIGPAVEVAFDGIEFVMLPILIAALLMPRLYRPALRSADFSPSLDRGL